MVLPVSVCMILRDEEEYIERSIHSFAPWVQEIVVMDFGSIDSTLKILNRLQQTCACLQIQVGVWPDDFAAARNQVAQFASQEWIFFIDGDEVLDPTARGLVEQRISQANSSAFCITQRNYSFDPSLEQAQLLRGPYPPGISSDRELFYFDNQMDRLYRRRPEIIFEGQIHESLSSSLTRLGLYSEDSGILIHHYGRLKTQIDRKKKLEYYLKLTEAKCRESPDDSVGWIEWMVNLSELREDQRALKVARDALKRFPNNKLILFRSFQVALRADQFALAEAILRDYLRLEPKDVYAQSQLSTSLLYQKKFVECEELSLEILVGEPKNFLANLNLAILYFEHKNFAGAKRHLAAAQVERPNDPFVRDALNKVDLVLRST